jgi:hypothetical protein
MAFAARSLAFGREPRQSAELLSACFPSFPAVKTMKKCHKLQVFESEGPLKQN